MSLLDRSPLGKNVINGIFMFFLFGLIMILWVYPRFRSQLKKAEDNPGIYYNVRNNHGQAFVVLYSKMAKWIKDNPDKKIISITEHSVLYEEAEKNVQEKEKETP